MSISSFARGLCLVAAFACSTPKTERNSSGEQAPAASVVRIGYQKIGSPFLLKAHPIGLQERLQRQGARLEWIEFQAGPALLEAMRGRGVDIGYVGETPPVFAQAGNVPFVYVAVDPPAPASEAIL